MNKKSDKESQQKMQMRRIYAIDEIIRSGKRATANKIAELLEVNLRTVNRDIEYMRDMMNAPIEYDRAEHRYVYTEENYFVKAVNLSEGELFSIALFDQLLAQYRNTPLEKNLKAIFQKIEASLPNNVTVDSAFLNSNVTFISDHPADIDIKVFKTIFTALHEHMVLEFDYRPLQKTTYMRRTLEPYHAVCQKGNWYVIGKSGDKGDVRIFSFARMKNAKKTRTKFTLPQKFRVSDYFDKEMGVWLSDKNFMHVELVIAKEIGTYALDRHWNSTQKTEQLKDGSVCVTFQTSQMREVLRWVLGQGSTVRVVSPPELIDAVRKEADAVVKIYAE